MAEIADWSAVAGSNNATPPAGWPEGMAPSDVNNTAREGMAVLARWHKDTNGSLVSGGSANAYTLTPNRTVTAYAAGLGFVFRANFANTGAATLNVSGRGAVAIRKFHDQELAAGDIESGQVVAVVHDGTLWQMISPITIASFNPALYALLAGAVFTGEVILPSAAPTNAFSAGFRRLPAASIGGSGTVSAEDSGRCVFATGTVTFPSGVFALGDVISVYNNSGTPLTLAQGSGLNMRLHGTATTGSRTLAGRGFATVLYLSASECVVLGDVT